MYTVTITKNGREQTAEFKTEWQAAQHAVMFLDRNPVVKDPNGNTVPLYAECRDSEY